MRIPPVLTNAPAFEDGITAAGWGAMTYSTIAAGFDTFSHSILKIQPPLSVLEYAALRIAINPNESVNPVITFDNPDGSVSYVKLIREEYSELTPAGVVNGFLVEQVSEVGLGWFNCWSFGNGVESNRVGDTFNKPFLLNGAKASTTLDK